MAQVKGFKRKTNDGNDFQDSFIISLDFGPLFIIGLVGHTINRECPYLVPFFPTSTPPFGQPILMPPPPSLSHTNHPLSCHTLFHTIFSLAPLDFAFCSVVVNRFPNFGIAYYDALLTCVFT